MNEKHPLTDAEELYIRSLDETVDLKFRLLTQLARQLMERGPLIIQSIDEILLADPGTLAAPLPPPRFSQLLREAKTAKRFLDSANSAFEQRIEAVQRIAK